MNKKILAVAVGAAIASVPMFANADVTVYGAAHLSVDHVNNGNAGANSEVTTLSSNSSFIGFKAVDDLGGGMKGIFGAEWQVAFDGADTSATVGTAPTGISNRNVYAGLQGGFGTIRLGNYDDVMKQVGRKVDLFHNEQLGESRALTRDGNFTEERLANSFNYESPSLGGVTLTGNYGMENSYTATAQSYVYAVGVQYSGGPVYVGAAYKTQDTGAAAEMRAHRVSASFNVMKGLKLVGLYQNMTNEGSTNHRDRSIWGAGAAFSIGHGTIKGQLYTASDNKGGVATAGNGGAHLIAIGYDHDLSKNTMVYVTYTQVENETGGTYNVFGAGHNNPADISNGTITAKKDPRATSIGVKVKF